MVTLDANEQYAEPDALHALVDRLDNDQSLAPFAARLLYIEQPLPRDLTWQEILARLAMPGGRTADGVMRDGSPVMLSRHAVPAAGALKTGRTM